MVKEGPIRNSGKSGRCSSEDQVVSRGGVSMSEWSIYQSHRCRCGGPGRIKGRSFKGIIFIKREDPFSFLLLLSTSHHSPAHYMGSMDREKSLLLTAFSISLLAEPVPLASVDPVPNPPQSLAGPPARSLEVTDLPDHLQMSLHLSPYSVS